MTEYDDGDLLQLSGLQHFAFCRRQWAICYIEMGWAENVRTVEGKFLHERAHSPDATHKRGKLLTVCDMPVVSRRLGVSGACDVVEFRASPDGVELHGREGKWLPCPVEYKRGEPKECDADRLQLCCQAMCLEEMLCCEPIGTAYLYYGETRHREAVELTKELRGQVEAMLREMHELYRRQYTPKVKRAKSCNACSVKELCVPGLMGGRVGSAAAYVKAAVEELG